MITKVGIIGSGRIGIHIANMLIRKPSIGLKQISLTMSHHHKLLFNVPKIINISDDNKLIASKSDILILAIHPEDINSVCSEISDKINKSCWIISTAISVPLDRLCLWLNFTNVIRCMPNITCITGNSIVPYYSRIKYSTNIMDDLFKPNVTLKMDNDEQIDFSAVVSSYGPALITWYIDCIKKSSKNVLPEDKLKKIIRHNLISTSSMLNLYSCQYINKNIAPTGSIADSLIQHLSLSGIDKKMQDELVETYNKIINIKSKL